MRLPASPQLRLGVGAGGGGSAVALSGNPPAMPSVTSTPAQAAKNTANNNSLSLIFTSS